MKQMETERKNRILKRAGSLESAFVFGRKI
jgi:hypothetical protein